MSSIQNNTSWTTIRFSELHDALAARRWIKENNIVAKSMPPEGDGNRIYWPWMFENEKGALMCRLKFI